MKTRKIIQYILRFMICVAAFWGIWACFAKEIPTQEVALWKKNIGGYLISTNSIKINRGWDILCTGGFALLFYLITKAIKREVKNTDVIALKVCVTFGVGLGVPFGVVMGTTIGVFASIGMGVVLSISISLIIGAIKGAVTGILGSVSFAVAFGVVIAIAFGGPIGLGFSIGVICIILLGKAIWNGIKILWEMFSDEDFDRPTNP